MHERRKEYTNGQLTYHLFILVYHILQSSSGTKASKASGSTFFSSGLTFSPFPPPGLSFSVYLQQPLLRGVKRDSPHQAEHEHLAEILKSQSLSTSH